MVKSVKEFCLGTYPICDLMPSGIKSARSGEKRRGGEPAAQSAEPKPRIGFKLSDMKNRDR